MKKEKLKKGTTKKLCMLSLSAIMLTGLVMPIGDRISKNNVVAMAETRGSVTKDGRTYSYSDDGSNITLTYVYGKGGILNIPSSVTINGKSRTVTALGDEFGYGQNFDEIVIPDTVTTIGNYVFSNTVTKSVTISSSVKKIGKEFFNHSRSPKVVCNAKNIDSIGKYCFSDFSGPSIIVLGNWLVRYENQYSTLDLEELDSYSFDKACKGAVSNEVKVDTLIIGNKEFLVNEDYIGDITSVRRVYYKDKKIESKTEKDILPKIILDNYDLFVNTKFMKIFTENRTKAVLNSLGIKYYGDDAENVKGTLKPEDEMQIAAKLHNYLVKNYIYSVDKAEGPYLKIFNTLGYTICMYDAEMYAYLLESAGVEAEVVFTGKVTEITKSEYDSYEGYSGKNTPYNNYRVMNDGKYYKVEYSGKHAWDVVKIGGEWYHVDLTNNRTSSNRVDFLVSDNYLQDAVVLYPELSMDGNRGMHGYPFFANIEIDDTHKWQTAEYALKSTNCKKAIGNVNDDLFINETDANMIQAYTLLSSKYKDILANVAAGKYKATAEEVKEINSLCNNTKLIDDNGKCIFNLSVADTNFDGTISIADVTELRMRLCKMSTKQNGGIE